MSVAGVVILTRHGDRQGFYQSPTTYTATDTTLTVLGYLQEYQNGQDLRNRYLTPNTSTTIAGLNTTIADSSQFQVLADAGGEGTVIVDSANAMMQGLYPAYNESITLANGTTVSWNDRAQLIQIQTVEAAEETWLEGWTSCNSWTTRLNKWYNSDEFVTQAKTANPFYKSLSNILGNRPQTLQNAWNLFDYMNVESIHNSTIASQISPQQLAQARYWANYHEAGSFTDPDLANVGNIAGQAILPPLMSAIENIQNTTQGLKFSYFAISYKPFMSLFTMWDLPSPLNDTVVDYASAALLEIRTDDTMQLLFRNGTTGDFTPYPLFGTAATTPYPIADFMTKMQPYSLVSRASWCDICETTSSRGCSTLAALNGTGGAGYASVTSTTGRHHVSPVVAGIIGACVTLAVASVALALWLLLSSLFLSRKRRGHSNAARHGSSSSSINTRANSDHQLSNKESADHSS